ncbi:dephospho-CoA kinase [Campylobacter geochelonis]|uniref:Dephospho-CoA kinase n=1 Tax=Campylobacter geochelonis TaxID=1780362 RepID=A0A128EBS9_9BACT|nr:dephospho-CoA kinase [Campylobacter geochelonis]QKF70468.1 dephospho-CoA kinase [Campylobacter geochelonis]CZE46223.1 dephospho-CoA kinase [Campylobacter geochelonis]CZE46415.1 dephospho-CoA kinase [Campylobacter geochelonis]CZE50486.1 dephospho-CoA kinase [Campylobacter geochelonis]
MQKYNFGIVITGSIGSGKSTVCELLKQHGFCVIDADRINHEILNSSSKQIAEIFGDEFIKDGTVDRKKLGALVFNDKIALEKLENFLHPKIKEQILALASKLEAEKKPYFVDIPLFFERQSYEQFDKVLVVYAPQTTLISRVMKRNLLTKEAVLARLNLQLDIEKKRTLANFIIDNSADLEALKVEVEKFLHKIKEIYADIKI